MNGRRKHQAECGADESMYGHNEQRRNFQSKPFQESTRFTLLPPRPGTCGDTRRYSRNSEPLGLQVQGFCCPLQQRPGSGKVTHRVAPQSRGGADGRLTLLSSLKGSLESRARPASRSRTGGRPEMTPQSRGPAVSHCRDPVGETAETLTAPCDDERQACHRQPSITKVSALHLYLPSSRCEDEEWDAETVKMRTTTEETSAQECEVKPNKSNPSHTSGDQPHRGPSAARHNADIL